MNILCLCREEHHLKLIPGYAAAFRRRGVEFTCVDESIPFDASLEEILRKCPVKPSAIFHFESAHPLFPMGVEKSDLPTICFHPDTYAFTARRIRWSMVFDQVAVYHPGYVERFVSEGHPNAFLLPHAVRAEFFANANGQREFEVGWVGQWDGAFYRTRAEWLPKIAAEFHTNDWRRSYSLEELADIYSRSKIVVNISRDDFPQDANMRVFEALASGALLLTSLPTELEQLGFRKGVHFVGYREPSEVIPLIRKYLANDELRDGIAEAGRQLVMREHTYDRRAEQLVARIKDWDPRRRAPARNWRGPRARLVALDFYAAHGLLGCAANTFRSVVGRGFRETIEGAALLSRAYLRFLRSR